MSYYIIRSVGFYPFLQNPFREGRSEVAAAPGATKPILYFAALKGRALASSSHHAVFFPSCFLFIYFGGWGGTKGCVCLAGELNWLMESLTNAFGSMQLRMRRETGTSLFVNSELL